MNNQFWIILLSGVITWFVLHQLIFLFLRKKSDGRLQHFGKTIALAESGAIILSLIVLGYQVFQNGYQVEWRVIIAAIVAGAILGPIFDVVVDHLASWIESLYKTIKKH